PQSLCRLPRNGSSFQPGARILRIREFRAQSTSTKPAYEENDHASELSAARLLVLRSRRALRRPCFLSITNGYYRGVRVLAGDVRTRSALSISGTNAVNALRRFSHHQSWPCPLDWSR